MNLGPYELNQIYTGDARELAKAIPDESIDLIFTDPVYQNINDYRWLAETAARVLKPDRACLVWTSTPLMSDVIQVMSQYLTWAWCLYWNRSTDVTFYPGRTGITVITPCLWYEKGKSKKHANYADYILEGWNSGDKSNHQWSKPRRVIEKWLTLLSLPGDIIFDPFTGGGTVPAVCKMLGRNYLAFEIDPATADKARQRVEQTQPPLFVLEQPEQLGLGLDNGAEV